MEGFARFGEENYESPPGPFVPADEAAVWAGIEDSIAAYERRRVAQDLGLEVDHE
jgi:hypothetical protein